MEDLCLELGVKYDGINPQATVSRLIQALSALHEDSNVIFMVDELQPCSNTMRTDWSSVPVCTNVCWMLAMQPSDVGYNKQIELILPPSEVALSYQFLSNQRNCPEIQQFYRKLIELFHTQGYLSLARDVMADEAFLPAGHKPVWLQCRKKDSLLDRLKFIVDFENVKQYKNIRVLYEGNLDSDVKNFCASQKWICLP